MRRHLHGNPSRSRPCRWTYTRSRHVHIVGFQRIVSRNFESGYIADVFEIPNRDAGTRQAQGEDRDLLQLRTHSLILDSYETCLTRARRAWALCVCCSTIHSCRPDISSGPSADREDPPQNNPRLTLRGDVPARCTPQVSIPRLSQGCLITISLPTQPPYLAKGKRQTL